MQELVSGVHKLEGVLGANVYLLESNSGLTLVDSGMFFHANRILSQMAQAGYSLNDLKAIVITHWHGDHSGGAAKVAAQTGAQVMAHVDEAPVISKTQPIPASSSFQASLNWLGEHAILPRQRCQVNHPLKDGEILDALDGIMVIHAPGHTAGSLCLYQPDRQILFCGDAIFNKHPLTQKRGIGLYMRLLTLNVDQARQTARELADLPVQVLCPGHGEPIVENAGQMMRAKFLH